MDVKHLAALAVVVIAACPDEPVRQAAAPRDNRGKSVESEPQLTIVVDVRCDVGLSYANVWNATVRNVVHGKLADRTLELRILPNPEARLYAGRFQSIEEKSVKLRLRQLHEMPFGLEGFVAADGTIWQLVDVDAK